MLTGKTPFTGPNPLAVMNARLQQHPAPPRSIEPSITPQLQEIIYRALEREPRNRYGSAREFARDLEHQDQVGVANRPEAAQWMREHGRSAGRFLTYVGLVLAPVAIFALLVWVARRR
jgi:serine/threonine-protein kinase